MADKGKMPKKSKRQPQRGVSMREEFFAKIGWTRSFISGRADPLHNTYMVWCQLCKKKISIRSEVTMEILRHHRTERHLRRDQRWRYEHLRSVDPVTNKLQHRVRGRNWKLLSKIELARELPKLIHTELVDTGERLPFYHDFIEVHKLNYSVFGHIDFSSVLRGLVISQGGSLTTDWIQRSPELTRVSNLSDILHLARF